MCHYFQIFPFLAILLSFSVDQVYGVKLDLYEHSHFRGWRLTVGEFWSCFNLPANWNDRVSSINTLGNCVRVFEHSHCQGSWTYITPDTHSSIYNNLQTIGFNDRISSVGPCNGNNGGGGSSNPSSVSSVPEGDWRQLALNAHNRYRAKHGVPPLKLSDELNRWAQKCAEYLAANRIYDHVCKRVFGFRYADNLFKRRENDAKTAALESVKGWYDEEPRHNYNSNTFQYPSGHFSQVVWKDSKHIGMGFARNGDFKVIVALYDPHGNVKNHFLENVFRPIS